MSAAGTLSQLQLSGAAFTGTPVPLAEAVRPFGVTGTGISFLHDGGRDRLSYHELAGRAAAAAARLRAAGAGPGAMVATTISNDVASVVAVLGTWAAGATVVSLPPAARRAGDWHARQFNPVLRQMGCEFYLGAAEAGEAGPAAVSAGLRYLDRAAVTGPADGPVTLPDTPAPADALIQFTSGSVGTPKGVAITAAGLAGHIAAFFATGLPHDPACDRIASWLPLYHDFGLIVMVLAGLTARMDQVLAPPSMFARAPASWLAMLARERATVTAAPNFAFRLAAASRYDEPVDLSRMRMIMSGGERIDGQAMRDFHAVAGPMGLRWETLTPCYGLAEGTVGVTADIVAGPVQDPGGHVSVGVPLQGVQVMAPPAAEPGPIRLSGDWLFRGYHTATGFEPAGDGWFDTGDDGFISDGRLHVLGRRTEVLSVAGRNVFAEDVESVAQQAGGPRVLACAAFRNTAAGGRFGLLAEVSPRLVRGAGGAGELARAIQAAVTRTLGTRLAPVAVVRLGTIPRTTSGKVQRARCRASYDAGEISRRIVAEVS